MYFVAVHHVACGIWPDLRDDAGAAEGEEKAVKLLQVVVSQGSPSMIKDVVSYRQKRETLVLPPACFELDDVKDIRRSFVQRCGPAVTTRLSMLLE